ncbi:MAG: helix-turn-helix domain-containing protein [Oscillospiraceae bacterium]|jgi:transcriptional regulator with XRE-family HTH domain|nr:helix-turn-helix domain-containing protein [Oscillospiraceae bacterium]
MNSDFPRLLSLLRKEKGISQKSAAKELDISQALLSHYEKGIRECGLDFLIRCSKYYGVSTDYLLGLSPDRNGITLSVEDIPEPESSGKENQVKIGGSILPTLNKKLIANSLNVVFDIMSKSGGKELINELSGYIMLAVYKAFRLLYSFNKGNSDAMFKIHGQSWNYYAGAAMQISLARSKAFVNGDKSRGIAPVEDRSAFEMDTQKISTEYPLFAASLFNLIRNTELKIETLTKN